MFVCPEPPVLVNKLIIKVKSEKLLTHNGGRFLSGDGVQADGGEGNRGALAAGGVHAAWQAAAGAVNRQNDTSNVAL